MQSNNDVLEQLIPEGEIPSDGENTELLAQRVEALEFSLRSMLGLLKTIADYPVMIDKAASHSDENSAKVAEEAKQKILEKITIIENQLV